MTEGQTVRLDSDKIAEIYEPGKGDLIICWERRWGHILIIDKWGYIRGELGDSISEAYRMTKRITEEADELIEMETGYSLKFYEQAYKKIKAYLQNEFGMTQETIAGYAYGKAV